MIYSETTVLWNKQDRATPIFSAHNTGWSLYKSRSWLEQGTRKAEDYTKYVINFLYFPRSPESYLNKHTFVFPNKNVIDISIRNSSRPELNIKASNRRLENIVYYDIE